MKLKKINILLLSALTLTTSMVFAAPIEKNEFVPGRILIVPKAGLTEFDFDKILKSHSAKKRKVGQSNLHIVNVPLNTEKETLEKLKNNPNIKIAELDRIVEPTLAVTDPYFPSQYHLKKIGADLAWDKTQGENITVGILDTGFDGNHPDLKANLLPGYNAYMANSDTSDSCGHGTNVAGTLGAITNNALGVAGVAGKVKILPIKIVSGTGSTPCYSSVGTIADAIIYAADHGARIVNVSFGNITDSLVVLNSGEYLKNKGGLLFIGSGNDYKSLTSAETTSAIVVGATTANDTKAGFSNYGNVVTLTAPGEAIYTTAKGSGYASPSGTSFASPIAAGVGALVMSANPKLTSAQVENILFSTAVDLGTPGKDVYFGYGRVNADAAVRKALDPATVSDTTPPVASITSPTASSSVSGVVIINLNVSDNVGVTRVELYVNNKNVAIDNTSPFGFSWDSKGVNNGMNSLYVVAYDAAGNRTQSKEVVVNVANTTPPVTKDITPPTLRIVNPVQGYISGVVTISLNATDDSGNAGITQSLYVDNRLITTAQGSSLAYAWNTNGLSGNHVISATAVDKAGNKSSAATQVTIGKPPTK